MPLMFTYVENSPTTDTTTGLSLHNLSYGGFSDAQNKPPNFYRTAELRFSFSKLKVKIIFGVFS